MGTLAVCVASRLLFAGLGVGKLRLHLEDPTLDDLILHLSPSRRLAYTDTGDHAWPCVLFFHGAPSSRLRIAYLEPALHEARVRAISPDRPGYGGSTPLPGRRIPDWAGDVERLAGTLGLRRFVVAGHSSGGAYALSCAAALPDLVAGVILLGAVTDMGWPEAWEGGAASELALMRLSSEEAVAAECRALFGSDGAGFLAASGMTFSGPDERLYADDAVAQLLSISRVEAFRQGVAGYAQDVFLQGQPWPFDPASIQARVVIAHGDSDTVVPLLHSQHTAGLIPRAEVRLLRDHGHFSILAELPALALELLSASA